MIKTSNKKMIEVQDWDKLVEETYGKPYSLQQQDGCKDRGIETITIPTDWDNDAEMHDSIPEEINGEEMGVKFEKWLARDPKQEIVGEERFTGLFWERNFYPDLQKVANDLHSKGLIEAGEYVINIDW